MNKTIPGGFNFSLKEIELIVKNKLYLKGVGRDNCSKFIFIIINKNKFFREVFKREDSVRIHDDYLTLEDSIEYHYKNYLNNTKVFFYYFLFIKISSEK